MPPRYAYWTIIAGTLPTAFRAATRAELEPTFRRILDKHPDAEMKWFARGTLWASPEAARDALEAERQRRAPARDRARPRGDTRGADWRPGGLHRDPRQPYKDAKKARNAARRRERFDRRQQAPAPAAGRPDRPSTTTSRHVRPATPDRDQGRSRGTTRQAPGPRPRSLADRSKGASHRAAAHGHAGRRQEAPRRAGAPPGRTGSGAAGVSRPFRPKATHDRSPVPGRSSSPKPPPASRSQGDRPRRGSGGPRHRANQERPETPPKRPPGPDREPRPGESPEPTPPPRPSEPVVPPPGPPERGR
jgi:hypothetical protein